jgi:DNA-binding response OmpR family regulator
MDTSCWHRKALYQRRMDKNVQGNHTPNKGNILVIDDEPNLRRTMALILERAGYNVKATGVAAEVRQLLKECDFHLAFLDLEMPGVRGLDLLPELRLGYPHVPILILTAHASLDSAIEAVRKGARDYLLKPIDPEHIIARIAQILEEEEQTRRKRSIVSDIKSLLSELNHMEDKDQKLAPEERRDYHRDPARYIHRGHLMLDLHTRQVVMSGRKIPLSPTGFDYLATLVRHSPGVVNCEILVEESQGYQSMSMEAKEIARWRIHELRRSLEPDPKRPKYIITVRGVGYRLVT